MLQTYPAERGGKLVGLPDKDYEDVKKYVEQKTGEAQESGRDNRPITVVSQPGSL